MLERLREPAPAFSLPNDQNGAYDTALRHSARVKRLKIILPLGAAIISFAFIAVSVIRTGRPTRFLLRARELKTARS